MSIKAAFNFLLQTHSRVMLLETADFSKSIEIKVAPSNYFRNFAGPEEVVVEGQEFIIAKDFLQDFGTPKRGDRLVDQDLGENTITEIRPMHDYGGAIIGYRVRTS
jgi:hypothetical protein